MRRRFYLLLMAALVLYPGLRVLSAATVAPTVSPQAQPVRARITDIRVEQEANATVFAMRLSSSVPFKVGVKSNPDRVELDFPALSWSPSVAASGIGAGLIAVYREGTSPDGGTRIVIETAMPVRVSSAGSGLAAPGQPSQFELALISADGASPPRPALAAAPQIMMRAPIQLTVAAASPPANTLKPVPLPQPIPVALMTPTELPVPAKPAVSPSPRKPERIRHIVAIDPGHGGIDPGTASPDGVFEKKITLASGQALKAALEATGRYTVVMTRSEDRFVPLQDRVKIARSAGAELFISLHCDAMEGKEAHGATVYSLSENASDAVSDRLAQQENRSAAIGGVDLAKQDDGIAATLIDLSMRQSLNGSNRFAELLVGEFGQDHIRLQELKPHRSAGFAVLKAADMPSVLIEMGYLSDPEDAEQLGNPKHQKAVATAITAGVDKYFRTGGRS